MPSQLKRHILNFSQIKEPFNMWQLWIGEHYENT